MDKVGAYITTSRHDRDVLALARCAVRRAMPLSMRTPGVVVPSLVAWSRGFRIALLCVIVCVAAPCQDGNDVPRQRGGEFSEPPGPQVVPGFWNQPD